ncbi:kinase-like protein [Nadsonia fulvescens var. elongata DSM 6958]|uniref:Kinase-like protein n=1 Tax=Nadsonia fulvescens var. elongata DSM 6958 TaxID=857566 RepID=A0A1E3PHJ2_9ASCO|nr:kinase-like protein [Nadsonia fulvescens var. elongata DSM 6958]
MDQEGSIELRNWPAGQSMNEAQQRSRIVFRRNINTDSHFTDEDVEVILALRANNRTPHFHNNTNGNVHVPLYRKIYRLVFALILLTAGFPLMVLQTIWHRLRFLHAHLNFRDNVGPILLKILVHVITFTVLPIVMGRIVSFVIGQDFILYPDGMPIYENTTTIVANNSNLLQLNNSIPSNSSANFSTFSSMRRSGYHTNLFEKFTMVLVTELGCVGMPKTTKTAKGEYMPYVGVYNRANFTTLNHLGQGSFGIVSKVKFRDTNRVYAIKKCKLTPNQIIKGHNNGIPLSILREIQILSTINHENIIKISQILKPPARTQKYGGNSRISKIGSDAIYLVFPFIPHTLNTYKHRLARRFRPGELKRIMAQLVDALSYLHNTEKIIHRDLKPDNVLIDSWGSVTLIDFGISRRIEYSCAALTPIVTSLWYRAPEVLLGQPDGRYGFGIDLWALGCMMIELASFEKISSNSRASDMVNINNQFSGFFSGSNEIDQLAMIFRKLGLDQNEHFNQWPELESLLKLKFSKLDIYKTFFSLSKTSFSFDYILGLQGTSLLSGLLTLNPAKRLHAKQAARHEWFSLDPKFCEAVFWPSVSQ